MKIRLATPNDIDILFELLYGLAEFEKLLDEFFTTKESLAATLFDPKNNFHAILLEDQNKVCGMAIYYFSFVTFVPGKGLFLEDLYVPESLRGKGYGKALLKELANIGLQNNCVRFEWNVLKWNKKAIDFYEAIGAKPMNEWVTYRMDQKAMEKFAVS